MSLRDQKLIEYKPVIYPAQCGCGHIYLEHFKIPTSWNSKYRGFSYCGFCRKRRYVE